MTIQANQPYTEDGMLRFAGAVIRQAIVDGHPASRRIRTARDEVAKEIAINEQRQAQSFVFEIFEKNAKVWRWSNVTGISPGRWQRSSFGNRSDGAMICQSCGQALTHSSVRGWMHPEGGMFMVVCPACGWKGGPYPSPGTCAPR